MVRWWNGMGWSDVATPAGPGVAIGSMPSAVPPGDRPAEPPREEFLTSGDPPPPGRLRPWLIGLGVLGLVVVVVAAVLGGFSSRDEPTADPETPTTGAVPSTPRSFPPGTVRIIDEAAGISYPHLGNGWFEYDLTQKPETLSTAGQYFVTQDDPPSGGIYLAECTSGPIAEDFGWTGPDSLPATAVAVAESQRANYYPFPNEKRVLRDEPRTVDGHEAHLYEFQLSWDVPGYDATGERVAVLLVDTGRPTPAMLFLSIPNTHAELYGVVDRVLDDVDVLD
jgi:hypothetical protein